jgi:hypothetical protein
MSIAVHQLWERLTCYGGLHRDEGWDEAKKARDEVGRARPLFGWESENPELNSIAV